MNSCSFHTPRRLRLADRAAVLAAFLLCFFAGCFSGPASATEPRTTLGIDGTQFTLNGEPTFLLGISYYGALSAPDDFLRQDLDDMQRHGFNWLRVWATWNAEEEDVSAVNAEGGPRQPFLKKLKWLVAECDRRGMVVDVTLTRSTAWNASLKAHRRTIHVLVDTLKVHRNWYLDLANERDVRDARHVPPKELKELRELVRQFDPGRLVTASFGGHDLRKEEIRESLEMIGLDFLAPHRPRHAESPGQTEARTRECLAMMETLGYPAPVHHQEPFRRGYSGWDPVAEDFLTDLHGAIAGGAAGWCFHNGSQRTTKNHRPRRSFDMRERRLFEQLDDEERKVVERVAREMVDSNSRVMN